MKLFGEYDYHVDFSESIRVALDESLSDKASLHGYHTIYSHLFHGKTISSFLEIGLFLNELRYTDLTAWEIIFPEASIYGIDKKREQLFSEGRIKTFYADQEILSSFDDFKILCSSSFDIILDDASHVFANTILTFEALYPILNYGGMYLIEDIADSRTDGNKWQQTIGELEDYFVNNGYSYDIFQSRTKIDNGQVSDNYILSVFK